ncbi:MAG: division/cell wall cluster transcriptional repressor MraZ [Pirellulales bacterium]|nr:division/cell wall cluster transcriptional repressor MraZ [Pirellulales bacterium]
MLTGTYLRTLDEKLRVTVPRAFREAIKYRPGELLYIAPGMDGSLGIYTEASFARLAERLSATSPTAQHVRAFSRLFFARAHRQELSSQGRFRIAPELAELAQIKREVVLLGVQDHIELWASDRWQTYLDDRLAHYDEIAEAALGG